MKSFDEWFNTYENLQCDKDACEGAYEAGAASRQGEIDKIKSDNQLSESQIGQACAQWREIAEKRQVEVDELKQEVTRLKYIVGEKIGNMGVRCRIDAEVHRKLDESKKDREFITDNEVDQIIREVMQEVDENPNKYQHNIYKQVDELQERIDTALCALFERDKTKEHRIDQVYKILKGNQND